MTDEEATDLAGQESPEPTADEEATTEAVDLLRGGALTPSEVEWIATGRPVRIVVLAGPSGSGKTTLVGSIYERFQKGQVGELAFAGSLTLPAFEERCELARASSGKPTPDTAHTPRQEGFHYLHLCVQAPGPPTNRHDLLFADVTGEMYQEAKDSSEVCRGLSIVRRAHALVLFLDGVALVESATRHACIEDARRLLRRLLEERMLGPATAVELVYSKWDEVLSSQTDGLAGTLSAFDAYLTAQVRPYVGAVRTHKTAGSPKRQPELGVGWGVDSLLGALTAPPAPPHFHLGDPPRRAPRDFLAFREGYCAQLHLWSKPR